MSGRSSEEKGRRGELEVVRILRARGHDDVWRGGMSYGTTPDVTGLPGVHLEIKYHERTEIDAWMDQAERDAVKFGDGFPVVIHRRSRRPWKVTMRFDDWLQIYEGWQRDNERTEQAPGASETASGAGGTTGRVNVESGTGSTGSEWDAEKLPWEE